MPSPITIRKRAVTERREQISQNLTQLRTWSEEIGQIISEAEQALDPLRSVDLTTALGEVARLSRQDHPSPLLEADLLPTNPAPSVRLGGSKHIAPILVRVLGNILITNGCPTAGKGERK